MKRSARILTLAAPLAAVAFSLGASPALAEPAGPAIDQLQTAQVGPVNPHLPVDLEKVPADPDPDPDPDPTIPGGLTGKQPCPTHGPCGTDPGDEDEKDPGDDSSTGDEFEKPTRIDAGTAAGADGTTSDPGTDFAWVLTGGVLVAMSGAAYAVRRRERSAA